MYEWKEWIILPESDFSVSHHALFGINIRKFENKQFCFLKNSEKDFQEKRVYRAPSKCSPISSLRSGRPSALPLRPPAPPSNLGPRSTPAALRPLLASPLASQLAPLWTSVVLAASRAALLNPATPCPGSILPLSVRGVGRSLSAPFARELTVHIVRWTCASFARFIGTRGALTVVCTYPEIR